MNKTYFIWLDDIRNAPAHYEVARTYSSAIQLLNSCLVYTDNIHISFDHDLGEEKSGYDVAKYIVENHIPCTFSIHSMNPVGAENIRQLMTHYGYVEIKNF